MLVCHVSYKVAVGLMGTLHEYLMRLGIVRVNGHADGIEAYHLLYCLWQSLILNCCRYAEILEFVIEEHDGVFRLLLVQLAECLRNGDVIKSARDVLGHRHAK